MLRVITVIASELPLRRSDCEDNDSASFVNGATGWFSVQEIKMNNVPTIAVFEIKLSYYLLWIY